MEDVSLLGSIIRLLVLFLLLAGVLSIVMEFFSFVAALVRGFLELVPGYGKQSEKI